MESRRSKMPKMKTHSGAKKRFKVIGKAKVKYKKPGQRHLLIGDSSNKNRMARKPVMVKKADMKAIKKLMPYSF
jgi:large subunit ribosomal protein L35